MWNRPAPGSVCQEGPEEQVRDHLRKEQTSIQDNGLIEFIPIYLKLLPDFGNFGKRFGGNFGPRRDLRNQGGGLFRTCWYNIGDGATLETMEKIINQKNYRKIA